MTLGKTFTFAEHPLHFMILAFPEHALFTRSSPGEEGFPVSLCKLAPWHMLIFQSQLYSRKILHTPVPGSVTQHDICHPSRGEGPTQKEDWAGVGVDVPWGSSQITPTAGSAGTWVRTCDLKEESHPMSLLPACNPFPS